MAVSVEDLNKPDILAEDYKKVGITSKLLARKHKEELEAHEVRATYDKDKAHFKYSKQLVAWPIRQKARQDAQKNLGLVQDKLHVETDIGKLLRELAGDIDGSDRGKLPSEQEEDED